MQHVIRRGKIDIAFYKCIQWKMLLPFLFTTYFPSVEQMHHGQERKKIHYEYIHCTRNFENKCRFILHASILSFKDQTPHNKYH